MTLNYCNIFNSCELCNFCCTSTSTSSRRQSCSINPRNSWNYRLKCKCTSFGSISRATESRKSR